MKAHFFCCLIILLCSVRADAHDIKQLKLGNFALPSSQQPGPLFGYAQNIIDKHDTQLFLYPDFLLGPQRRYSEVCPALLYGIRDNLSIFVELPLAVDFKLCPAQSSGPEDFIMQLEYAPYEYKTETSVGQLTLVSALLMPTGNNESAPMTGFGSTSFFLGGTVNYTSINWYGYVSPFALLTTSHDGGDKAGNILLYQAGFGRMLHAVPDHWILLLMLEFYGLYAQKNKVQGVFDPNSGGNGIFLGPSLWFSTKHVIVQAGVAPLIYERLNGEQPKNSVYLAFNLGWKFH